MWCESCYLLGSEWVGVGGVWTQDCVVDVGVVVSVVSMEGRGGVMCA